MSKFWLLLFCSSILIGQTKKITGTITAGNAMVEGIHVINLSNEKTTITDAKGVFTMDASEDDLLVFNAVHLEFWRQSVSAKDFANGTMSVKMTEKTTELEEVVVKDRAITLKDLGINYTPKRYTVAERRLYTATSGGGILPLDPIINWISGRTKMLKKELANEKKNILRTRLSLYAPASYCIDDLKIPEIYVEGFLYYAVEDPDLFDLLDKYQKDRALLKLSELSFDFLESLKED